MSRSSCVWQFGFEEVDHLLDGGLLALLGQHRVVRLGARQFHRDECIAQQRPQRVEPRADQPVVVEAQTQHLAPVAARSCDPLGVGGRQVEVRGLAALPRANGSDGWLSTGATITLSTIIPSANPPLKHIPTAPTPGPPADACRSVARARSQPMIGDVCCSAQIVNSRAMHTFAIEAIPYGPTDRRPGRAQQRRHHDRESGRDHVVGECRDLRGDAGDLVDHDHAWTRPAPVHQASSTVGGELAAAPTVERGWSCPLFDRFASARGQQVGAVLERRDVEFATVGHRSVHIT